MVVRPRIIIMYFLEVPVCIFLCPFVSTIAGKLQYHCGSTGVFPRWYWRKYVLCLLHHPLLPALNVDAVRRLAGKTAPLQVVDSSDTLLLLPITFHFPDASYSL